MIGILLCNDVSHLRYDEVDLPHFFPSLPFPSSRNAPPMRLGDRRADGTGTRRARVSNFALDSIQYSPCAFSPESLSIYVSDFSPSNASARRLMSIYRIRLRLRARTNRLSPTVLYLSQFQVI